MGSSGDRSQLRRLAIRNFLGLSKELILREEILESFLFTKHFSVVHFDSSFEFAVFVFQVIILLT